MRDFIANLEHQLSATAGSGPAARARRRPMPRLVLSAVAATAIVIVALLLGSGKRPTSQALALPVLKRSSTDVSRLSSRFSGLEGARTQDARRLATPFGDGYVIPTANGLCLAIPDVVPESYGSTCARTGDVKRVGLAGTLIAPKGAHTPSLLVAVLPEGATAAVERPDGTTSALPIDASGVARLTVTTGSPVVVLKTPEGGQQRIPVPAHEPEGRSLFDCGNGNVIELPPNIKHPRNACH